MARGDGEALRADARLEPDPGLIEAAHARLPATDAQRQVAAGAYCLALIGFSSLGDIAALPHTVLYLAFLASAAIRLGAALLPADAPTHAPSVWPSYTIIGPMFGEPEVALQFVRNMLALDYPVDRLQILLALETGDTATLSALSRMRLPAHMRIVMVPPVTPGGPPKTKPRACNHALRQATGEMVVIFDAEDRPHPGQLKAAAAAFAASGSELACVQAPLRMVSRGGFLGAQFELEYAIQFGVVMPALTRLGLPIPLGGTSNHFRTDTLRRVGAWDPYNVTEDADLGLRLGALGYRTLMIAPPTEEAPPLKFGHWLKQRTRWIKGYMQTFGVRTRGLGALTPRVALSLILTVGLSIISALVNGPFLALLGAGLLARAGGLGHATLGVADMALIALTWLSVIVAGLVARRRTGAKISLAAILSAPIYWLWLTAAAFRAAWQLCRDPFLWEKTPHYATGPAGEPQLMSGGDVVPFPAPDRPAADPDADDRLGRLRAAGQRPWAQAGALRLVSRGPPGTPVSVAASPAVPMD